MFLLDREPRLWRYLPMPPRTRLRSEDERGILRSGMDGENLKAVVRKTPFEPIEIGLSDGRIVPVRHPDQVVISRRHVIFGLAQVRRPRGRVSTPADGDAVAKDWMLVGLFNVVSAEPARGTAVPAVVRHTAHRAVAHLRRKPRPGKR